MKIMLLKLLCLSCFLSNIHSLYCLDFKLKIYNNTSDNITVVQQKKSLNWKNYSLPKDIVTIKKDKNLILDFEANNERHDYYQFTKHYNVAEVYKNEKYFLGLEMGVVDSDKYDIPFNKDWTIISKILIVWISYYDDLTPSYAYIATDSENCTSFPISQIDKVILCNYTLNYESKFKNGAFFSPYFKQSYVKDINSSHKIKRPDIEAEINYKSTPKVTCDIQLY
jgi:hypothetical protein